MRKSRTYFFNLRERPLTRQNLNFLIASERKDAASLIWLQAAILFAASGFVFFASAFLMITNFYNAPISISKRSWIQIRNLTPAVPVQVRVNGVLEKIFVSQGQLVQKGALLGAVRTASITLDYHGTRKDFADKVVELHCLASLQSNKSVFKRNYPACFSSFFN